MIILKKLKWSNCFSYGADNELDLDLGTVTQIVGVNGVGKSSIPLIIEEVFYNKNSANKKKSSIPNRHINQGYYISLSWEKDGDEYEVITDRRVKIKVVLTKNGKDISSHTATNTYKTIQEILGIDFKTFSQLVYQSTTASLQFLTATDTNRKKFLIDLLHLEEYTRLYEVFKELVKNANTDAVTVEAKLATVEKWLQNNKLTDTTILPMLELEIFTENDQKESDALTAEIGNIAEKNKKILKNNQYKSLLNQISIHDLQTTEVTSKQSYDSIQQDLGVYSGLIQNAKALITKMKRLGDKCPTCDQNINQKAVTSIIETAESSLKGAEEKSNELNTQIKDIKRQNQEFEEHRRLQENWENLFRSIDQGLPETLLDEAELRSRLGSVQRRLKDARESITATARENEERTRKNTRIQIILEQTDTFIEELKEYQEVLDSRRKVLSLLEVLKKAFSTNGLLAYKIENLVKDLETLVNHYLVELSDGQFSLEFVVLNDKLNVEITDDGKLVDITDLSSGELARVNTATLLAIRRLMNSISKSRINILFLDEVIAVLDDAGRETLVEVLLKEQLNTYIVSHAWSHPLLDKIMVIKEDKISRLEK